LKKSLYTHDSMAKIRKQLIFNEIKKQRKNIRYD